ncbi:pentatricopeptide repeat-containing protein At2g01860 [Phalaenopsis equestris]|uniref:pentatricopeptide repeat-containing protein At2g01860 n=1 Tax=Phalaenopsis equestris TaxID=78828 RepID=UPI0009E376C8|nr:pentatricopeptide repeat-containing protein At2g01860 [Phalaenopsis equestris]XP_020576503.1 pentatricopeptide repeat-containing protein At2g01860 [Phalaenopsis equestris]
MEQILANPSPLIAKLAIFSFSTNSWRASSSSRILLPKILRYTCLTKSPLGPEIPRFPIQKSKLGAAHDSNSKDTEEKSNLYNIGNALTDESEWSPDELEAIAALFQRRMSEKPEKRKRERPIPLPSPHRKSLHQSPTPKRHIRLAARENLLPRSSFTDQVFKNPEALIRISREIAALPPDVDASEVLDEWSPFLRKGSLSMTIRELGHMGLPKRALETFCWVQKQRPFLFPDDRTLSSTIEVLARNGELKIESELEKFLNSASRCVVEAMVRGFIKGGNLSRARRLLVLARDNKRTLETSLHAKLILEAGRTPNGYKLALALLDELGERESLDLKPQDTTSIMKVCIKLGRFETVERLFNWFKDTGRNPSIVMYTTVIFSRYCSKRYEEGLTLVWEMEELDFLLDLPAYRVVIRLCVALNDLERAVRYFLRLKEAGFAPTYDIYKDMIKAYATSGRLAKCRKICKEVEMAGLKLDKEALTLLSEMEGQTR